MRCTSPMRQRKTRLEWVEAGLHGAIFRGAKGGKSGFGPCEWFSFDKFDMVWPPGRSGKYPLYGIFWAKNGLPVHREVGILPGVSIPNFA